MIGVGAAELVILLFFAGGPFNQFLGLPPGQRDANLLHAAPADSLLYVEWSARGDGKPGAPGIDGFVADPEIVSFVKRFKAAVENVIARNAPVDQGEAFGAIPDFVLSLSGKPGCLFWGLDSEAVAEGTPPPLAFAMSVRAGLVVSAGDDAERMATTIKSLIKATIGAPIDELDHTPLPLPAPVQIHRHKDYILLATGVGAIDDIIKRLEEKQGGIGDNQDFAAGWDQLGLQRTGLLTFIDIENAVDQIGSLIGLAAQIEGGMQMAGMTDADWAMSVTGVDEGDIVSHGRLQGVSGNEGLMALASGRGIKQADFALVPADCDLVMALSMDVPRMFDAYVQFVGQMNVNASARVSQGYELFADYIGLDLRTEVFDVLDQVAIVSNSPSDGGFIGSSPVLTIGIKDVDAAATLSQKIAEVIVRELPNPNRGGFRRRGAELERFTFLDHEVRMLNVIGKHEMPIAPCWCLTDSHVMIALHPQPLKSRLRRMAEDDWESIGGQFEAGDGDTIAYSQIDLPQLVPRLYGLLPYMTQILFSQAQAFGFEMNQSDLPSAAAIVPYLTKSESRLVRTADGLSRHTSGPPVASGLPSLAPLMLMTLGVRTAPVVQDVEVIEAVEAEAAEEAIGVEAPPR